MKKGTKFRESKGFSKGIIFNSISSALDKYCSIWARKEKIDINNFKGWLVNIKSVLRNKLFSLHRQNKRPQLENLKNPTIQKYLK